MWRTRLYKLLNLVTSLMNLYLFNDLTDAAKEWVKEQFYYTTDSVSLPYVFPTITQRTG